MNDGLGTLMTLKVKDITDTTMKLETMVDKHSMVGG